MNNEIDVKIERILAIKEIIAKLIDAHQKSTVSTRADWFQSKIDILLKELTHEN